MKISEKLINMTVYNDKELCQYLENNGYSQITAYLRDGRKKQETIKEIGGETKTIDDDYDHVSFTDKWVEWMTIVARK